MYFFRNLLEKKVSEQRDILFKCIDLAKSDFLGRVLQTLNIPDINNVFKIDSEETLLHFAASKGKKLF